MSADVDVVKRYAEANSLSFKEAMFAVASELQECEADHREPEESSLDVEAVRSLAKKNGLSFKEALFAASSSTVRNRAGQGIEVRTVTIPAFHLRTMDR